MYLSRTISSIILTIGATVLAAPLGHADTPSKVSVSNGSVTEGASGTKVMTFTVVRSSPFTTTTTVGWSTSDGTATAGSDYVAASGTATILPGKDRTTFTVTTMGDTTYETDEYFRITLTPGTNSTIQDGEGIGAIFNDDPAPPSYNLNLARTGPGAIKVTPAGTYCGFNCARYVSGTVVTLTAVPATGYQLGSWTGCDSPSGNVCTMTMTSSKAVTASFVPLP